MSGVRVEIDNRRLKFEGSVGLKNALDDQTSYKVDGYFFSPAYKSGRWDGRVHMLKKVRNKQAWTMPIGLLPDLLEIAKKDGYDIEVEDLRTKPNHGQVKYGWNAPELRPYQNDLVRAALEDRGYATGKAILSLAPRGGKTLCAAKIIHELGLPTIFLVQSERVLGQTIRMFERVLEVPVGVIGGGAWDPKPLTVATCQSLIGQNDIGDQFDCVFFDECHHVGGDEFRVVLENIDAFYKFGISATVRLDLDETNDPANIWIRGAIGPKVYERSISDLIRDGFLVQPTIELSIMDKPQVFGNYASARSQGIVHHDARNAILTEAACEYRDQKLPTLGIVREKVHARILQDLWREAGLKVDVATGETPSHERDKIIGRLCDGKTDAVIGTIFNEGIDIPPVAGVINAAGGESWIDSIQRLRNLTLCEGKTQARVRDVMDMHNKYLTKHAHQRLQHYRAHEAFKFELRDTR